MPGGRQRALPHRGRYSAATFAARYWPVADRCDGTFTQVRRGVVDVFGFAPEPPLPRAAGPHAPLPVRASQPLLPAAPRTIGTVRPRPNRLERLPEQYFATLLDRVAAVGADGGRPVVDLGRGNPEVGPPPHVVEALRAAAARPDVHGYAPIRGLPRLREAIAERYRAVYGAAVDPDSEVAIVPGTKTAIVELSTSLAARGDTILLPDPYYPDYPSGAALAGAHIGLLPLDPAAGGAPTSTRRRLRRPRS